LHFTQVEQEPGWSQQFEPPAYWPSSGSLRAVGLSARYSEDSPDVLKDLNFEIQSGERIGIVGRTGAGKSSLALALLRAIKTSGSIYFDGRPIHTVNLAALRSSITVIPQQAQLLPGTIRDNLDPFHDFDDSVLNGILNAAGLFETPQSQGEGSHSDESDSIGDATVTANSSITLDTEVRDGGTNFSVGQRQIVSLARAMLRRSKLLILDEATASIDYRTDGTIQKYLRTELDKDTTVLTVAHRLQTIMDSDRIMVLDAGRIVEFDNPKRLLAIEKGVFKSLVYGSNDRSTLLRMVNQ